MQVIGASMILIFFTAIYFLTAKELGGYWMAAKLWAITIFAAIFIMVGLHLLKGGSL